MVSGITINNGSLEIHGYPLGSSIHSVATPDAEELNRLTIFRSELKRVEYWLAKIEERAIPDLEDSDINHALADAALLAFSRCFDFDHPLKPLRAKEIFKGDGRKQVERLRNVRHKLVAHAEQVVGGVFTLIVQSPEKQAIETLSLNISIPFHALGELECLRQLNIQALNWVSAKHEGLATNIVKWFNGLPLEIRSSAPDFVLKSQSSDPFAPKG